MLTIAAISPISAPLDLAAARSGGDPDAFASLLTPREAAPTTPLAKAPDLPVAVAAPLDPLAAIATATPQPMKIDAFALPIRQSGAALPPTGTAPPLAAAPTPASDAPPATNDARLLVLSETVDPVPGDNDAGPVVARQRPRLDERQASLRETTPSANADRFAPLAAGTSPEQRAETDEVDPARDTRHDAAPFCTTPGDPVATAAAVTVRPIDPPPLPAPAQAQTPVETPSKGRDPSDSAPAKPEPASRVSPATGPAQAVEARPASRPDLAVRQGGSVRARHAVSPADIGSPDPAPVATEAQPERRTAAPHARAIAVPTLPTPAIAIVPDTVAKRASRSPGEPLPLPPKHAESARPPAHPDQTDIQPTTRIGAPADLAAAPQVASPAAASRSAAPPPAITPAPVPVERSATVIVPLAEQAASPPARYVVGAPLPAASRTVNSAPKERAPAALATQGPIDSASPSSPTTGSSSAQPTLAPGTASPGQVPPAPAPTASQRSVPSVEATASAGYGEPAAVQGTPEAASPLLATPRSSDMSRPTPPPGAPVADTRASRPEPTVAIAPAPAPLVARPATTILPAFQAFGAALHRAAAAERRPAAIRDTPELIVSAPAPGVTQAASPVTEPGPLDTTQPRWPDAMIGRIEQLRDLANEADTRIRLHPDALGTVDVALRREGDVVRVHFTAAEPATRTLLADAQPRLQELADARGLKLGGAAVDSGGANTGERRQPTMPQPPTPARPRPSGATASETQADTRLA